MMTGDSKFSLLDLPIEVLEEIMDLLSPTDILSLLGSAKSIQKILKHRYHLIYDFETVETAPLIRNEL